MKNSYDIVLDLWIIPHHLFIRVVVYRIKSMRKVNDILFEHIFIIIVQPEAREDLVEVRQLIPLRRILEDIELDLGVLCQLHHELRA